MYTLVQTLAPKELVLRQAPAIFASLVIAELFYKFGSFTLECLAFLATWAVLDSVASLVQAHR